MSEKGEWSEVGEWSMGSTTVCKEKMVIFGGTGESFGVQEEPPTPIVF